MGPLVTWQNGRFGAYNKFAPSFNTVLTEYFSTVFSSRLNNLLRTTCPILLCETQITVECLQHRH